MIRILILVLIICIGLGACHSKAPGGTKTGNITDLILVDTSVINLFADMHYLNVAVETYKAEKQDSMRAIFRSQLFEIHNTDSIKYNALRKKFENDYYLYYEMEKRVHARLKEIQK